MTTIIRTDYEPHEGPQLHLVTNPTLVWQLRQIAGTLPIDPRRRHRAHADRRRQDREHAPRLCECWAAGDGMRTKFTPGPWRARTNVSIHHEIEADGGHEKFNGIKLVAKVLLDDPDDPPPLYVNEKQEADANLALIADAPKMFELLSKIVNHFEHGDTRNAGPMDLAALAEAMALLARHQS